MPLPNPHNLSDPQIWSWFAQGRVSKDACPTALALAAYLDGRADVELHQSVEAHLAGCEQCRETLCGVHAMLAEGLPGEEPARSVIERAKSLVPADPTVARGTPVSDDARWRFPRWASPAAMGRWGLAAAASIAICMIGYQAGTTFYQAQEMPAAASIVDAISFGTLTEETDVEMDLLALATGVEVSR